MKAFVEKVFTQTAAKLTLGGEPGPRAQAEVDNNNVIVTTTRITEALATPASVGDPGHLSMASPSERVCVGQW
jgi:hypothetical protein